MKEKHVNQVQTKAATDAVEEIEIIPDQSGGVDLSAEFAELNDAAPVMQEGLKLKPTKTMITKFR